MEKRLHLPLIRLREGTGLDREQWSEAAGMSRSQLSQYEHHQKELGKVPALRLVERFRPEMDALGITLEDLLRG